MQRIANPCTSVRFRLGPPEFNKINNLLHFRGHHKPPCSKGVRACVLALKKRSNRPSVISRRLQQPGLIDCQAPEVPTDNAELEARNWFTKSSLFVGPENYLR